MTAYNDKHIRLEIVEICRKMSDHQLVAGTEGNVSGRADGNTILMTPSGFNKADVTPDMLVRLKDGPETPIRLFFNAAGVGGVLGANSSIGGANP